MEALATKARTTNSGLGRLTEQEVRDAVTRSLGFTPDDTELDTISFRFPGLGPVDPSDQTRSFVDGDLAQAASAGDVFLFVENPYRFRSDHFSAIRHGLSDLAASVVFKKIADSSMTSGKVSAALNKAAELTDCGTLAADIVKVCLDGHLPIDPKVVVINEADIDSLEFNDISPDLSFIRVRNAIADSISLDKNVAGDHVPRFEGCLIGIVHGRQNFDDLPKGRFDADCTIEEFSDVAETNKEIIELPLDDSVKVLLVSIKKLFVQPGRGRRESAFFRGKLNDQQRALVRDILGRLSHHGFATRVKMGQNVVWLPQNSARARALRILSAPMTSVDPLVLDARSVT